MLKHSVFARSIATSLPLAMTYRVLYNQYFALTYPKITFLNC